MPSKTATTKKAATRKKATSTRKKTTTSAKKNTKDQRMVLGNPGELNTKIRQKAYEMYQQRGGWHGADMEDWLKAEREVKRTLTTA